MAKVTRLIDDLDGESEAEMTLKFGLDGRDYEIDLNDANYENYRAMLELLSAHGRVVETIVAKKRTLSTGKKTGTQGKTQEMREWLRSQGHQVSDRGRVPQNLVELWNARPKGEDAQEAETTPEKAPEAPEEVDKDKAEEAKVIERIKSRPVTKKAPTKGKQVEIPALTLVGGDDK